MEIDVVNRQIFFSIQLEICIYNINASPPRGTDGTDPKDRPVSAVVVVTSRPATPLSCRRGDRRGSWENESPKTGGEPVLMAARCKNA